MATHTDPLRNKRADAVGNAFNGDGATLTLRTGAGPGAAAAATGTLLVTITLPTTAFGAAVEGVISKAGTWSGTAAVDGEAGHFRITKGTDVLEGTVAVSDAELNLDSVTIVESGTVTVDTFTYTVPVT